MKDGEFLYKRVYSDLKAKLQNGQLLAGEKLPEGKELCEQYEVSMITVKRAMDLLAEDKLICRIPGKGTFAAEQSAKEVNTGELSAKTQEASNSTERKLIGVILEYAMPSFGLDLLYELDRACGKAGYRACIRFSYGDREREIQEIGFLMSLEVEGLIIFPCHGSYYNTALLKLVLEGFPVVVLDKKLDGIQVPSIRTDNRDAVYRLIDHLKDQGKSQIGIITVETGGTVSLAERRQAFREKIQQLHLPVLEECILPDTSYRILKQDPIEEYVILIMDYLKRCGKRIDSVICMEYGNLLAFLEAAQRMRQYDQLPQIMACSVDQVYLVPGGAGYVHIKQDEASMADKAVEILKLKMAGEKDIPEDIRIPGILRKLRKKY